MPKEPGLRMTDVERAPGLRTTALRPGNYAPAFVSRAPSCTGRRDCATSNHYPLSTALFVPQRHHGIDLSSAPGGKVTRHHDYECHNHCDLKQCLWIGGSYTVKQARNQA